MADASDHLSYLAAHLADEPAVAGFASRLQIAASGDEVVLTLAGRRLAIRMSGQGLAVGSDEVGFGADPQATLSRVAKRIGQRLRQMDEQGL